MYAHSPGNVDCIRDANPPTVHATPYLAKCERLYSSRLEFKRCSCVESSLIISLQSITSPLYGDNVKSELNSEQIKESIVDYLTQERH